MVKIRFTALAVLLLAPGVSSVPCTAGERPTFNHYTRDPRPDIWPHPIWLAWPEFRRTYNRPRYEAGWMAAKNPPTSQEAMVWAENVAAGRYERKRMPPMYKRYLAPKPWEILNTGARPDFPERTLSRATQGAMSGDPTVTEAAEIETDVDVAPADPVEVLLGPVPTPLEGSPSDR